MDTKDNSKKKKKSNTVKTFEDTSSLKKYDTDWAYYHRKKGFMNIMEIETKDIVNASEDQIEYDIAKLTKFNKLEYESYKIIAMNFPCNTLDQQEYLNHKIRTNGNRIFQKYLNNSLYELQWVQDNKSKREFYIMFFSDSLDGLRTLETNMKTALNIGEYMLRDMTKDKKELVLFRLNNPASILKGGL